jgi:hypothetical protein
MKTGKPLRLNLSLKGGALVVWYYRIPAQIKNKMIDANEHLAVFDAEIEKRPKLADLVASRRAAQDEKFEKERAVAPSDEGSIVGDITRVNLTGGLGRGIMRSGW